MYVTIGPHNHLVNSPTHYPLSHGTAFIILLRFLNVNRYKNIKKIQSKSDSFYTYLVLLAFEII